MHTADDHLVGGLSHDRPCCYCGHAVHVLRCGAEVVDGVFCPCRDVPVPGAH